MTLPASGSLSFSQINVEVGQSASYGSSMSWIASITKAAQRTYDLNNYHSKAYYQRNVDGNCNNGNTNCNCNCGDLNCNNCINCTNINCANCDAQNWLQTNCNCACTYNCNSSTVSFNCDCDCVCIPVDCACACVCADCWCWYC